MRMIKGAELKRVEVLGVPVDCVDMQQALISVENMLGRNRTEAVVAVNPEKVIKAQYDAELQKFLESAALLIPDGIGMVVAAKLLGLCNLRRVPGSELMPEICRLSAHAGYKIFLYGATPEVNEKTYDSLIISYPGIVIAGRQHGYHEVSEMPEIIERINNSGAQILFVALGSPRQEQWMNKYMRDLDSIRICQGVGGTFDVISGHTKRAPLIFRNLHLEWLYRLGANPSRIGRQIALPKFVIQLFNAWLKKIVRSS